MSSLQFWCLMILLVGCAVYIGACIERAAARLKHSIEWASRMHVPAVDEIATALKHWGK